MSIVGKAHTCASRQGGRAEAPGAAPEAHPEGRPAGSTRGRTWRTAIKSLFHTQTYVSYTHTHTHTHTHTQSSLYRKVCLICKFRLEMMMPSKVSERKTDFLSPPIKLCHRCFSHICIIFAKTRGQNKLVKYLSSLFPKNPQEPFLFLPMAPLGLCHKVMPHVKFKNLHKFLRQSC